MALSVVVAVVVAVAAAAVVAGIGLLEPLDRRP
jgi:hypothetical protein